MELLETIEGKVPGLPDLFAWSEGEVRMICTLCHDCNTHFFPEAHYQHRPGCPRENMERVLLNNKGKLATYTVQHYMCPPPFKTMGDITPYGLALVEFPEEISIAGLIVDSDLEKLKIGLEMETTTFTLHKDDEGNDVVTWAFRVIK